MIKESDKKIIRVLKGEKQDQVPVWFMRQAGRYLPEYRALRAQKGGFLDMAYDPKSVAEITVQPIRRFAMDAAIIFSDILLIPHALGQDLDFVAGEGPKLGDLNIGALSEDNLEKNLEPVYDGLQETRYVLDKEGFERTALIGFTGAPWTVATYMVEGGSSKDFKNIKSMAYGRPDEFKSLMDILVSATARHLILQVKAGAEVLQIFDSWSGALDPHGFQHQVINPTKEIVSLVKKSCPDIPVIGFPKGGSMHLKAYAEQTGVDAMGLDTITCSRWAATALQNKLPVQGNLDPMRLLAGGPGLEKAVRKILRDFAGGPHIFNLGHGINKETPIEHVHKVLEIIRE